jgi:hypothetical protein
MRRMMISAVAAVRLGGGALQAVAPATSFSADPAPHEHDQHS